MTPQPPTRESEPNVLTLDQIENALITTDEVLPEKKRC